jgi:hypothetical protein
MKLLLKLINSFYRRILGKEHIALGYLLFSQPVWPGSQERQYAAIIFYPIRKFTVSHHALML